MPSSSKKLRLCNNPAHPTRRTPGVLWIAADLHLSAHTPDTCRAFLQFLDAASTRADAVFLCGDIFDAWIGDDQINQDPTPWLVSIIQTLQRTAARIPLWLMQGNRDFLLGSAFAHTVGAQLLPDPVILHTDAGPVLLSHGDQYCTDDRAYQRLRRIVRNPVVQRLYLALPLHTRRRIATWLRHRSQAAQREKRDAIMDVNANAIVQALRVSGVSCMIHGHTHRPATHALDVDGRRCQRVVLSDWDLDKPGTPRMAWLQVDGNGVATLTTTTDAASNVNKRLTTSQPSQHCHP